MNRVNYLVSTGIGLIVLNLYCSQVSALPSDRDEPIRGEANNLVVDQKTGVSTYSGAVKIQQGSLVISADSITVHTKTDSSVEKIVAIGSPAHFQQQPALDQSIIIATADSITYSPDSERLLLINNASIEQDGQVMKAPKIDYDLIKEIMKANQIDGTRVDIFIPPKSEQKQ
jgi:lipopolysaccharide export system protein LptA